MLVGAKSRKCMMDWALRVLDDTRVVVIILVTFWFSNVRHSEMHLKTKVSPVYQGSYTDSALGFK